MLSRIAHHLFWMARTMARAAQARSACGEAKAAPCATAHCGVLGRKEINDAV